MGHEAAAAAAGSCATFLVLPAGIALENANLKLNSEYLPLHSTRWAAGPLLGSAARYEQMMLFQAVDSSGRRASSTHTIEQVSAVQMLVWRLQQ